MIKDLGSRQAPLTNDSGTYWVIMGYDTTVILSGFAVSVRDGNGNTVDKDQNSTSTVTSTYANGTGVTQNINGSTFNNTFILTMKSKKFLVPPSWQFFIAAAAAAFVQVIACDTLQEALDVMKAG